MATAAATAAAAAAAAALPLPLFPKPHPRSSYITRSTPPFSSLSRRTITPCAYRRRDSTAGTDEDDGFRRNRRRRRRRWLEDTSPPLEMGGGNAEEVLDGIFIFKLFRFYGWWLVPILISMLLATGPKAFLLALAVMTGLSVLTLAFTKLWGLADGPKRKFRAKKKKTRGRTRNNIDIEEVEEEEGSRMIYRSWVSHDDGTSSKGDKDFSDYKGWDELDGASVFNEKAKRRSPRVGRSRREEKFMRREGGGEMPLLLRLLIAVFPFLGSWTKML